MRVTCGSAAEWMWSSDSGLWAMSEDRQSDEIGIGAVAGDAGAAINLVSGLEGRDAPADLLDRSGHIRTRDQR